MRLPILLSILICILPLNSCGVEKHEVEAKPIAYLEGNILTYDIIISNNSEMELMIGKNCNLSATAFVGGQGTLLIYDETLEGAPLCPTYGLREILKIPPRSKASVGRVKVRLKDEILNDPTVTGLTFRLQAEFLAGPESAKLRTTEYDVAPEYSLMPLVFTRTWEELRR